MITPGINKYEVVLDNKYYLRELVESITLEDSLDEIAMRATVRLAIIADFPGISPGQKIRISGPPFGGAGMEYLLHPGVVWECDSSNTVMKHLPVTIYDQTIYLAKSEEEYLFPAGQTATQRLQQYAADWEITLGRLEDTGIPLAKAIYRAQPIYSMIMSDLKETVKKGGDMFRPRMTPNGLELYRLGSNKTVWVLESVEEINQRRTLEGSVTKVKVLGNAPEEGRSPVLAVVVGETEKYGTLQKVISDSKITDAGAARSAGESVLSGIQETISVTGPDINTLRSGDRVQLNKMDLIATQVKHELGSPGHMTLVLAEEDLVKRRYYSARSV
jgi:hypothetical protein